MTKWSNIVCQAFEFVYLAMFDSLATSQNIAWQVINKQVNKQEISTICSWGFWKNSIVGSWLHYILITSNRDGIDLWLYRLLSFFGHNCIFPDCIDWWLRGVELLLLLLYWFVIASVHDSIDFWPFYHCIG